MRTDNLNNDEKKKISRERQNAVRRAWKNESERIKQGIGTRKWSVEEQKEIVERGSVIGYEGHHMKSVSLFPKYAGEPDNIQFLTEDEHLYGAHNGSYHNLTNGYYDPYEKKMIEFEDGELPPVPEFNLENSEELQLKEEIINSYSEENLNFETSDDRALSSYEEIDELEVF